MGSIPPVEHCLRCMKLTMRKSILAIVLLLLTFVGLTYWSVSGTSEKFGTCEIIGFSDIENIDFMAHDSVLVAASTLYMGDGIKRIMQGEQAVPGGLGNTR